MGKFFGKKGYTLTPNTNNTILLKSWKDLNSSLISKFYNPKNQAELKTLLNRCVENHTKFKCIGAGHSFTPAAMVDEGGVIISLGNFNNILEIGKDYITLQAGCTLAQMTQALKEKGLMLPACPEYGPFYVGAIAGTQFQESTGHMHDYATVSSHVIKYKILNLNGEIQEITKDLEYWRVSEGLGGVILEVTYRVKPLQKSIVEFDILDWNEFWPNRSTLAAQYDEYFTIYIPLLDKVFIEKRTYISEFENSKFLRLNKFYSAFMRQKIIIRTMPWFYASIQSLTYKSKKALMTFGLNHIFRYFFTKRKFLSTGGDRGYAFKSRPIEIYNDYMFDPDVYPQVIEEMRAFFLQDETLAGGVLMATYQVAKDNTCILSRTYHKDCYCIDPVLYAVPNSPLHEKMQAKIRELAHRYKGRPHLNKVTNLDSDSIKYGYDADKLSSYLNWCNKQDSQGLLQNKFYRLIKDANS